MLYSKTFPFIAHVKNNRKNNDNNGRHNPQNRLFDMYVCMKRNETKVGCEEKNSIEDTMIHSIHSSVHHHYQYW